MVNNLILRSFDFTPGDNEKEKMSLFEPSILEIILKIAYFSKCDRQGFILSFRKIYDITFIPN